MEINPLLYRGPITSVDAPCPRLLERGLRRHRGSGGRSITKSTRQGRPLIMVWQEVVLAIGTTKSKKLVHLFSEKRLTDCPLAKMPPVVSGKDLSLTEEERALLKGNRAFM